MQSLFEKRAWGASGASTEKNSLCLPHLYSYVVSFQFLGVDGDTGVSGGKCVGIRVYQVEVNGTEGDFYSQVFWI